LINVINITLNYVTDSFLRLLIGLFLNVELIVFNMYLPIYYYYYYYYYY